MAMRKVHARVKGSKVEVVMDYKNPTQAKDFIANKYGVKPSLVSIIKTESA